MSRSLSFTLLPLGLSLVLASSIALGSELPERDRRWLDATVEPLISDYERSAYLALADARARSEFQNSFWEARDPVPGTVRNERKQEYTERVKRAGRLFGRGRASEAWEDVRGRLYVQLGAPSERRVYSPATATEPEIEDWLYTTGESTVGLPRLFHVVFYRPEAGAEFRLYSPVADGPEALVSDGGRKPTRAEALSDLAQLAPELAALSLSLIPAEPADLESGGASPGSSALLAVLADLHNRLAVDTGYVARVLRGTEERPVEHSFEPITALGHFYGSYDSPRAGMLHFAIQLRPGLPTVEPAGARVDGALRLRGRIFSEDPNLERRGLPVAYVDEPVALSLTPEDRARVAAYPFAIEEMMPLPPGRYRASFVVRDVLSGRFGAVESGFEIPGAGDAKLEIGPILLVSRVVPDRGDGKPRPYTFRGGVVYPSTASRVSQGGELTAMFQVRYAETLAAANDELSIRYEILADEDTPIGGFAAMKLDPATDGGIAHGQVRTLLRGLPAGDYTLRVQVRTSGAARRDAERSIAIVIVEGGVDINPVVYVRRRPRGPALDAMLLAGQLLSLGDRRAALGPLNDALLSPIVGTEARFLLAEQLLALGRPEGVGEALGALLEGPAATRAPALLRLGVAHQAAGDAAAALAALSDAAKLAPRSTAIFNALAEAASASGDRAQAIVALRRSLELDPDQRDLGSRIAVLEREQRSATTR